MLNKFNELNDEYNETKDKIKELLNNKSEPEAIVKIQEILKNKPITIESKPNEIIVSK